MSALKAYHPNQSRIFIPKKFLHCIRRPISYSRRTITITTASHLAPQDEMLRVLSENNQVSIIAVTCTQLVSEACQRHQTSPTASAALGRALLGTLLIASFREQGEKTQVTWKGDGPIGTIQTIASSNGVVKGKIGNPLADPPLRPDGKLNVGAAVGRGVLAVVRSLPFTDRGWQAPYTGMVPIRSGEIAEDLAVYLVESEQAQAAVALGVTIGRDLNVKAAGGYLINVLPFADDSTIVQLETNINKAGNVSSLIEQGATARDICDVLLQGLGGCPTPESNAVVSSQPLYGPCNGEELKGRMISSVVLLGRREVESILEEQGKVEVHCEFCRETFDFEEMEVMAALHAAETL